MKRIASALLLLMFLPFVSPGHLTIAALDGPGANGSYQFSTDNGQTTYIDFNVVEQMNGSTVGEMTFAQDRIESDRAGHLDDQSTAPSKFYLKAQIDCLMINKNKAVMSGTVSEANAPSYVGRRVLLVAQDNSQDTNAHKQDRLTWGIYKIPRSDWLPSDSERLEENQGVTPTWIAQDAERTDDVGVISNQNDIIGCESFPLSAFSFVDVQHGRGKIHVSP
jgi:hypothetical protein